MCTRPQVLLTNEGLELSIPEMLYSFEVPPESSSISAAFNHWHQPGDQGVYQTVDITLAQQLFLCLKMI